MLMIILMVLAGVLIMPAFGFYMMRSGNKYLGTLVALMGFMVWVTLGIA